ncbi:F-box/WD repeat-containing protein 7-like isoform X2 [Oratosquilla oratoria]
MMGERVVDINVATVEEFETLNGVGRAKAEAIVTTRSIMSEFSSVEDLMFVPGIGRSVIEQNRVLLYCSLPGATSASTRQSQTRRSLRRSFRDLRSKAGNSVNAAEGHRPSTSASVATSNGSGLLGNESQDSQQKLENSDARDMEDEVDGKSGIGVREKKEGSVCSSDAEEAEEEEEEVDEEDSNAECEEEDVDGDEEDEDVEENMSSEELIESEPDVILQVTNNENSGVISRAKVTGIRTDDTSSRGILMSGLGSDTPHEEGVPEIPLHVPFSPQQATDDDHECEQDGKDMEEDLVEEDQENYMTLDAPVSPQVDKKQLVAHSEERLKQFLTEFGKIKRKSEVCSDNKGACPVKKSCKAMKARESVKRKTNQCAHHRGSAPVGLDTWLTQYETWTPAQKLHALDSLIDICDQSQVRHIHQIILPQFQRDFISLLPKELALYVLSFLPPKDLLRAAQTCKYWNILAADNLLWREKCREAGIDDHLIVMDRRRKKGTSISHMSPYKAAYMRQHRIEMNWRIAPKREPRVLKGHDDHVITCLQFSGNIIVSGSDDNTLKVWNATNGKCMRTLTGHTGGVWSSQMCGNLIVSGSTDRMLRVWNAETGECTHTLYGHTSTVRCLHLHDNKVVSGSRDATLRVWDVTTGSCEHVLVGHVAAVRCVQYNGRLVVSGAYDYMVKVWNAEREECLHTLQGHTNRVYSLQFDGVHVVSGSLDTSIRVWDVETGQCRHTLMGHQSLTSGMELKNNILVSGNADSTVKVWDIITGQCLQTLSGPNKHRSAVTCLQFNNKFVVTSSDDGTVKLWDVRTGEFIRNLVALESGGSGGVVWRIRASDTKLVCAVGSRNGTEETKLLVLDFDTYESSK